jgi:NADH-quinone oxidoreductase subunit B
VEVKRELLGTRGTRFVGTGDGIGGADLRVRSLNSRQLLRGGELQGPNPSAHLEGAELERHVEERILTTTLDKAVAWARSNSFFPATFGLACCAIEMMSIVAARVDVARFGFEAFRASPRQADLLILSGRVSIKMAPIVRRIYDQMLEPKWAISMGACCSSMGVFNNYALVPADKFMPIDVHVPGCPPRPEALMHGVLKLRKMVQDDPDLGWRERYGALGTEEVVPETSADHGTPVAGQSAAASVFLEGDTAGA